MPDDILDDVVDETNTPPPPLDDESQVEAKPEEPESIELPHGDLIAADPEEAAAGEEEVELEAEAGDEGEPQVYTPPTADEWAELRERERQNAAKATALQGRLGEVSGERRELLSQLQELQKRLEPIEAHTTAQGEAAKRLREAAELPKPGTPERFQHDLKASILGELTPLISALEEKVGPVAEAVSRSRTEREQQEQRQAAAANLTRRALSEDASVDPKIWDAVQDWECRQAEGIETMARRNGTPITPEEARAAAVQKRYQLYAQHWIAQHSGQADPTISAPVALVEEMMLWRPPTNGTRPAPAAATPAQHHRALQREEPVPTPSGGAPPATGSPLDSLARDVKHRGLEGEALYDRMEVTLKAMQKKHPRLDMDRLMELTIERMEAI